MQPPKVKTTHSLLATFLFFALALTIFYFIALNRFIAVDEGFYLLAGKLVSLGKIPYLDFFYPQMPLLPYLHAAWISVLGPDWEIARIVTVLFVSCTAALLFWYVTSRLGLLIGVFVGLLFLTQTHLLGWFTVAKTYAFSSFPLLASVVCLMLAREKRKRPYCLVFLSGLCLGIAIDIRLFYLILIPCYLLYLCFSALDLKKAALVFFIGGLGAALPHLYFVIGDLDSYWFNNLGYHLVRSHRTPEVDISSKINILKIVTGVKDSIRFDGYTFQLLLWINLLLLPLALFQRKLPPFPTVCGLVLFGGYFIPNPVHLQYFSTCIPLFLFGIAVSFNDFRFKRLFLTFLLLYQIIYLHSGVARFTKTGDGVKGIDRSTMRIFTLPSVRRTSHFLETHFPSGTIVLSQWPGFLFETSLEPVSGLENQFWIRMDQKLTDQQVARYHLMTTSGIKELPRDPRITGLVIEERKRKRYTSANILEEEGFQELSFRKDIKVFKRSPAEE